MPEITPGQVIRREGRIDDDESDDDRDSFGRREPGGSSYHTVQRYRVTPSRVEPFKDERTSDRPESSSRPLSATEIRPRSIIVERYVERQPYERESEREHSKRTRTVERECDREPDFDQAWERGLSSRDVRETDVRIEKRERRDEPYELERYQRETEYYARPEPPQPIIIRQQPLEQKVILRGLPQPLLEEDRQIVRRESRDEDEYYYRKVVKESREVGQSDDKDVETSPVAGPLAIAAYHERGDGRSGRIIRRRESFNQGYYLNEDYSDDLDVVVRRSIEKENRSRSPRRKRHLAEGALAGAGIATLLESRRGVESRTLEPDIVGGVALGALGAEVVTRARSRYREHHTQDESRSRSSSHDSHRKIKTGLALAALFHVTDPEQRRRFQNRLAQRQFRDKAKEAKEHQDEQAENSAQTARSCQIPDPSETDDELSGLPWGSLSLKHVVSKGKAKEKDLGRGSKTDENRSNYEAEQIYNEKDAYYESDPLFSPLIHIPPSPVQSAKPVHSVAPTTLSPKDPQDKAAVRFSDRRVSAAAEHLRNTAGPQEGQKSQARSGAEIAATELAGAEVAASYEYQTVKKDREHEDTDREAELVSISKPQGESIPADNLRSEDVNTPSVDARVSTEVKLLATFHRSFLPDSGNEPGTAVLTLGRRDSSSSTESFLYPEYSENSNNTACTDCTALTNWLDEEKLKSNEDGQEEQFSGEKPLSRKDPVLDKPLSRRGILFPRALYGEIPLDTDEINSPNATPSEGPAKKSECENVQENRKSLVSHSQNSSIITESTLSDDATDWGEDSDLESYGYQNGPGDQAHKLRNMEDQQGIFKETLEPMKREMVDRLMAEFWIIFKQKWPRGTRECVAAPRKSTSASRSATGSEVPASRQSRGNAAGLRGRGSKENEDPDENPEKDLGGAGDPSGSPSNTGQTTPGFACPYRKRNSRKYSVKDWRTCALSPLRTVARVKGHLYRYHLIHQCQRCKSLFDSDEELDSHIETSERCDAILAPPVDGITRKMKAVLQSKRKAFPGQTEAERWKQIYQILFPDDKEVPDPYFDPIRDNEENRPLSPEISNVSNLEQFLYHNLSRLFRTALETEVNNEIQPMEERLREQLPNLVEHTLSRALLQYHAMIDDNSHVETLDDSGYVSNHSKSGSSSESKGKGPEYAPSIDSEILSKTSSNDNSCPSGELLSPFVDISPPSNIENTAHMSNTGSVDLTDHLQFQGPISNELHSTGWQFSDESSSFTDQIDCSMSDMMNLDSFNWELPYQDKPYSNYII